MLISSEEVGGNLEAHHLHRVSMSWNAKKPKRRRYLLHATRRLKLEVIDAVSGAIRDYIGAHLGKIHVDRNDRRRALVCVAVGRALVDVTLRIEIVDKRGAVTDARLSILRAVVAQHYVQLIEST